MFACRSSWEQATTARLWAPCRRRLLIRSWIGLTTRVAPVSAPLCPQHLSGHPERIPPPADHNICKCIHIFFMVILLSPQNNYFRPQRYSHTSQSSTGGPNSPGPHSPASPGPHLPLAEPISPRLPPTPPPPPPPLPPRRRRDSPEISSPQQVRHIRHFVCNLLFFFIPLFVGF